MVTTDLPPAETGGAGEASDAELISAVRGGETAAYELLYRRHAGSASRLARQLVGSPAEADDLVAEAFEKVLNSLRGGRGPDVAFRAYLLTTMRNALYDRLRRDQRLELSADMTRHDPGVPWEDSAVAGLESTLAARAFGRLPERWQAVLWHTEVEQEPLAEVALLLGLTPNGVAVLAYRAREGLREAYLQEHLAGGTDDVHPAVVGRLGAWARGRMSRREQARMDAHLATCSACRALAGEVSDVNAGLGAVVAPLVLGAGAAAYLAGHATDTAAPLAAAAAGSAAGSAAGWLTGSAAGQAVVAVVVGGIALTGVATVAGAPSRSAPSAAAAAAAADDARAGRQASPTRAQDKILATAPTASTSTDTAAGRSTGPAAGPSSTVPGPIPGPAPGSTPSTADPSAAGAATATAPVVLRVGSPTARRPLRAAKPGELEVTVRNDGPDQVTDLLATVVLPTGMTVRAGGSASPADWKCTGTAQVATCRASALAAGVSVAIRVKVFLGADATTGVVSGTLAAAGARPVAIPATSVPVATG